MNNCEKWLKSKNSIDGSELCLLIGSSCDYDNCNYEGKPSKHSRRNNMEERVKNIIDFVWEKKQ
jgi:hypothetical protein